MSGAIHQGLDYTAVNSVIDRKIPLKKRERVFDDVLEIEAGAIPELNKVKHGKKS